MSDTPRTDAATIHGNLIATFKDASGGMDQWVRADYARELERELAAQVPYSWALNENLEILHETLIGLSFGYIASPRCEIVKGLLAHDGDAESYMAWIRGGPEAELDTDGSALAYRCRFCGSGGVPGEEIPHSEGCPIAALAKNRGWEVRDTPRSRRLGLRDDADSTLTTNNLPDRKD